MPKSRKVEGWMTLREAADYAKVSRQSVYQAMRLGQIETTRIGRFWYVKKEEYDAYREKRNVGDLAKIDGKRIFDLDKGLYSVNQLSKILGVNAQHIQYLIHKGTLKATKRGRYWTIQKEDAQIFIDSEIERRYKKLGVPENG